MRGLWRSRSRGRRGDWERVRYRSCCEREGGGRRLQFGAGTAARGCSGARGASARLPACLQETQPLFASPPTTQYWCGAVRDAVSQKSTLITSVMLLTLNETRHEVQNQHERQGDAELVEQSASDGIDLEPRQHQPRPRVARCTAGSYRGGGVGAGTETMLRWGWCSGCIEVHCWGDGRQSPCSASISPRVGQQGVPPAYCPLALQIL